MEDRKENERFLYEGLHMPGLEGNDIADDTSNIRERERLSGGVQSITSFNDKHWKAEYIPTDKNAFENGNIRKNRFDRAISPRATRRSVAFRFDKIASEYNKDGSNELTARTMLWTTDTKTQMGYRSTAYMNTDNQRKLFRFHARFDDKPTSQDSSEISPADTLSSEEYRTGIDIAKHNEGGVPIDEHLLLQDVQIQQDEFLKRLHSSSNHTAAAAKSLSPTSDVSLASITSSAASAIIQREMRNIGLNESGSVLCRPSCELCTKLEARLGSRKSDCFTTNFTAVEAVPAVLERQIPTQKHIEEARMLLESRITQDRKTSPNAINGRVSLTNAHSNDTSNSPTIQTTKPCNWLVYSNMENKSSSVGETIRHRLYERTLRAPASSFITCSEPSIHRRLFN